MSKAVNSKWKKIFPDTIGNQNRPATGVDDTQPFETGAFPQYIANDPVRYDLQNAAMSQLMSNDARLKEMVGARGKELDDHKVDPGAHKTGIAGNAATATKVVTTAATGASANIAEATMAGSDSARIRVSGDDNAGELALETADNGDEAIVARQYTGTYEKVARTASILDKNGNTAFPGTVVAPNFTGELTGNAATATKLQTPRTLSLTGKAAGSATFDGAANASINVTSVNADTASKLSTARKINITGNASGSAAFDGTSDVSINVSVSQAAHADKATQDTNGRAFTDTNAYMHISALADNTDFNNVKTTGIYYCTGNTYLNRPYNSWGILTVYSIGTVKQEYRPDNAAVYYTREYDNTEWKAWSKVNAANADTATKLATPRTISLTGNASGSANFDGSGNVSIDTTVSQAKNAAAADMATNDGNGNNIANTYLKKATVIDVIYPVGSIYMSMSATNPATLFGVGTWARISQGRMLLGADDSTYKAGATGGEATHALTAAEMPAHSHTGTTSTNGDHTHQVSRNIDLSSADPNGEGGSCDTICNYDGGINFKTSTAGNHNHTFTTNNAGGGAAHNNMPPYLVCYIWQRTA